MEDHEQDANPINTNEADIPEERAIEQQAISFMGDNLAAALTTSGSIYISIRGKAPEQGNLF